MNLHPRTLKILALRKGHDPRLEPNGAIAAPIMGVKEKISPSIAFSFKDAKTPASIFCGESDGYIYPRLSCVTPAVNKLANRLLELELGMDAQKAKELGFDCIITNSGMSAIFLAVFAFSAERLEGDFISSPKLYGGTRVLFDQFLPLHGTHVSYVKNPQNLKCWKDLILATPWAKFLFAEDDANPTPIKLKNKAIADLAHRHNMIYICDRTIGTPILEQPLLEGTDIVIHSLSKEISGHSWALGGAIVGKKEYIDKLRPWFAVLGPVLDASAADRIYHGSLDLFERINYKIASKKFIVDFLKSHPNVAKVYHTDCPLIGFEVRGGYESALKVVEGYKLILMAPHLGDIRSISTHPASTTHSLMSGNDRQAAGISDGLVRLSVGLEYPQDIIADLSQALELAHKA